jgi:hypothetical protein
MASANGAAARRGDAQLGTLAGSIKGCVAAVGPGAALAAAKPDGTVTGYQSPEEFVAAGMKTNCPITIVDAGSLSDQIITQLANRKDITLIVTGVGPNPGSDDPSLQVVYRLGTTLPGWLTSASTRRDGIVTLSDLTRTLIEFGGPTSSVAVDGSPLTVYDANLTVDGIDAKISAIAALSDAAPIGYLALGLAGAVMGVIMVIWVVRGKFEVPKLILTLGGVLAAAMMHRRRARQYSDHPGLFLSIVVALWLTILTPLALLIGRLAGVPNIIAAAGITVAAFTVDAALGAIMQPGSMLNSRPIYGLRWYGFGNVTFAAYASLGLLLVPRPSVPCCRRAGPPSWRPVRRHRHGDPAAGPRWAGLRRRRRPTPAVLWLVLALSGVSGRRCRDRQVGGAGGAVLCCDWRRDGSAYSLGQFRAANPRWRRRDVVSRNSARAETVVIVGIGSLLIGVVLWIIIFAYVVPRISPTSVRCVTPIAVLIVAIWARAERWWDLVWLTATARITVAMGWYCWAERNDWTPGTALAAHR